MEEQLGKKDRISLKFVKCTRHGETPRSMYPERDGRMGSFGDQDFAQSLMEAFTDPARHARMMHASQAEYLLMVADNLGSDSNGDTAYVNLFGELPYEIESKLKEDYYGRFNQVGNTCYYCDQISNFVSGFESFVRETGV